MNFIETERGEVMVELEESFAGRKVNREAALLSDGTLRALAIAAALLSVEPGSTVIIEEVDNGIHPPRVGQLLDLMEETAHNRDLNVLVTTHNPALLDAIPKEELQHVVACYGDPDEGDSKLVTLGQLDRFPALVARGPLGQLLTKGILDRFLKERPEDRHQANVRWAQRLRSGE